MFFLLLVVRFKLFSFENFIKREKKLKSITFNPKDKFDFKDIILSPTTNVANTDFLCKDLVT